MLTNDEIATASPADLYEFRMAELDRARYAGQVLPLPPFRKVPNPKASAGHSDSALGTMHEMLRLCLHQLAVESTASNVAAHSEYLNGFMAGAAFATMQPNRDGWTEEERRDWLSAMSEAAVAARRLAMSRHAEMEGGAA